MQAAFASPFHNLHWNSQELADAVPLRLHELYAFDAARDGTGSAANGMPRAQLSRKYSRVAALPRIFRVC